jgi:hypothetical protein
MEKGEPIMANNTPTPWLEPFIVENAYTATKEDITKIQSQSGKTELIEKYKVVGELENVST